MSKQLNPIPAPLAPCAKCLNSGQQAARFDGVFTVYCKHNLSGAVRFLGDKNCYSGWRIYNPITQKMFIDSLVAGYERGKEINEENRPQKPTLVS